MRYFVLMLSTTIAAASLAGATLIAFAEDPPPEEKLPAGKTSDPTLTSPVTWMLDAAPLSDATATKESEMKSYKERIPGTEVMFEMVPISGGKFLLGSPPGEAKREAQEGPQVEIELEPFWMGKCEVSWDEYELWGLGYDIQRRKQAEREPDARDLLADGGQLWVHSEKASVPGEDTQRRSVMPR